jgi:hypothetical protein
MFLVVCALEDQTLQARKVTPTEPQGAIDWRYFFIINIHTAPHLDAAKARVRQS